MKNIKNSLYILTAGTLWGIISLFVSSLHDAGLSSMQIVAVRVFISSVILVLYMLITDRSQLKIRLRDIPLFAGTGILSIVFFNYCYFESIDVIGGAAVPALLLYTAPVFVMLMSLVFFREKITGRKIISVILALSGLALVTGAFTGNERISVSAVLLGLGSGFGYALYSIFGKFLVDRYSSITITLYTFIFASLAAVPVSGIVSVSDAVLSPECIIPSVLLALVSTVFPYILYTIGLSGTEAGKASVLATIEPLVAAAAGMLFLHEKMDQFRIAGMILVIASIIVLNVKAKEDN